MRLLPLCLTLALIGCHKAEPTPAAATAPAASAAMVMPAVVTEYLSALASVEQASSPVSLEAVFNKAEAAQTALMEITGDDAFIEQLSEADFSTLQTQVRGLKLHREMDIYAQPDPGFFLALAKKHGRPDDIAFFENYAQTWGPDLVPVYLKLRPQPSPCVRFGENRIIPLYSAWQSFAREHLGAYPARTAQQLADLEEAVALGTCACDGLQSVLDEQAGFLKQFPKAAKAAEIKTRREQLQKDPYVLPVNCR